MKIKVVGVLVALLFFTFLPVFAGGAAQERLDKRLKEISQEIYQIEDCTQDSRLSLSAAQVKCLLGIRETLVSEAAVLNKRSPLLKQLEKWGLSRLLDPALSSSGATGDARKSSESSPGPSEK